MAACTPYRQQNESHLEFSKLQLIEPLQRAVAAQGYTTPTPIQQQAIPHVLAGRDLLGLAQTGTGKTAAFALPILQRLHAAGRSSGDRPIRCLVLTPTRELASQIGESFATYGAHLPLRHTVIFGGVGQKPQERALRSGIDILIATPGRLLDLAQQRHVHLQHLEIFVLDEADRMLDMGFVHDVKRIIALLPKKKQTLFFSATMPPEAQKLADMLLHSPETVAVTPVSSTVERITQGVYRVEQKAKQSLLLHLLKEQNVKRALVFTRTKHGANRVAEKLEQGGVMAAAIHGNKSQGARERALAMFKRGDLRVLVATDLAARGIDIDEITHVFNFDIPNVPETYVHRIGRTARAGSSGIAIAFCAPDERSFMVSIERLTKKHVPVLSDARPGGASAVDDTIADERPAHTMRAPQPQRRHGGQHRGGGQGGNRGGAPARNGGGHAPARNGGGHAPARNGGGHSQQARPSGHARPTGGGGRSHASPRRPSPSR